MATLGFTDEPHIERIAAALWAREPVGSAALLVGAGFSRNAVPMRGTATSLPGWNDIYSTMVDQLYPLPADLVGPAPRSAGAVDDPRVSHREWLLSQAGATSAYLRVAEEFDAQFGRDALDKLILRHVPDRQFSPGQLHHMLVALPWADIMTTNWDTLLERAAEKAEERVYDILRTVEEIPEARAPRIIKLHGSFPAHRPFVFTEEDFRIYPNRAGAFVNLAQQLAMENTLVLMGFSGDDPNFLFWSGWVRDRLGPKAPIIYLVGVLNLTAPKRKMLESRRIQPIDLANLPEFESWPPPKRMENAHTWFLERLRAAEPYPAQRWPRPSVGLVPPLRLVATRFDPLAPLPDPESPGRGAALDFLRRLVEQWRHNRKVYPGWIVPPFATSELVWKKINSHIGDIVKGLRGMNEDERLDALFELNWQLEAALIPLILTVDDVMLDLLDSIAPRYGTLSQDQAAQYRGFGWAIVRHAREEGDASMFARWADWLEPRVADDPEARERLIYERCLKHRADLDIDALEALLDTWTVTGDTYWQVRKAGLLADLGRDKEASDLSGQALNAIREQTARGEKDIASWSRETFAMLLRSSALYGDFGSWEEHKSVRDRLEIRQEQLQSRGCPGKRDFFDLLDRLVQGPPPLKRQIEQTHLFDLGSVNNTHHMQQLDPRLERLLAYQGIRFQEETGMPARIGNVGLSVQLLTEAARWLIGIAPKRAFDVLLRAAPSGNTVFDIILARAAVARIETHQADALIERTLRFINAARGRIEAGVPEARFWMDRMKSALEVASRVILRTPDRATELLDLAVELNREERFGQHKQIGRELRKVSQRALEAAKPVARGAMLLKLFGEPIPPNPGPYADDDVDLAFSVSPAMRADPADEGWCEIVDATIATLLDRSRRRFATSRLHWLINSNLLTAEDERRSAAALWAPEFLEDGLPGDTIFFPGAFLTLPRPYGTDVQSILSTALLTGQPLTDNIVSEGGLVWAFLNRRFDLDEKQLLGEIERLHAYVAAHDPPPRYRIPLNSDRDELVEYCGRMLAGLARRALAYPAALEPLRALVALARYPLRIEPAIPALVQLNLLSAQEAMSKVRALLASDEEVDSLILSGLIDQLATRDLVDPAVDTALWQAFSHVVATRQPGGLTRILRYTAQVFRSDPSRIPIEIDGSLNVGLERILVETGNEQLRPMLEYEPFLVRYFGAFLLTAMDRVNRADPSVSQAWAEAIDSDPLPDMRRARDEALRPVQSSGRRSSENDEDIA